MNNMGREIMAALKRFQVGSDGDGVTVGGALVVSGATSANTFTGTVVNATTIDTTNIEVTNIKAKDGTASATIADSTGKITVSGQMTIDGIEVGQGAGNVATNTAVGASALAANEAGGTNNTAIGYQALDANTTGDFNTAVGSGALDANTTASNNTAVGYQATYTNTTGYQNTAVGTQALYTNATGGQLAAFGWRALYASTADNNSAFGHNSQGNTTTGASNISMGQASLSTNTTGSFNTALGASALQLNTTASNNTAVGYQALYANTTGQQNTALGSPALNACTTGNNNLSLGERSLTNLTTGSGNIGVHDLTGAGLGIFNITTENDRGIFGHNNMTNAYVKVAWTVTSDARDKTSIESVPHGLSFVQQLNPVSYRWKTSREDDTPHGNQRYGFLAQDILALEGDNPVIIDNEQPDHLKYQGEALVPVLVNAIKELSAQVTALQAEVNALKGQ
jgi:hypothetical protein